MKPARERLLVDDLHPVCRGAVDEDGIAESREGIELRRTCRQLEGFDAPFVTAPFACAAPPECTAEA